MVVNPVALATSALTVTLAAIGMGLIGYEYRALEDRMQILATTLLGIGAIVVYGHSLRIAALLNQALAALWTAATLTTPLLIGATLVGGGTALWWMRNR